MMICCQDLRGQGRLCTHQDHVFQTISLTSCHHPMFPSLLSEWLAEENLDALGVSTPVVCQIPMPHQCQRTEKRRKLLLKKFQSMCWLAWEKVRRFWITENCGKLILVMKAISAFATNPIIKYLWWFPHEELCSEHQSITLKRSAKAVVWGCISTPGAAHVQIMRGMISTRNRSTLIWKANASGWGFSL